MTSSVTPCQSTRREFTRAGAALAASLSATMVHSSRASAEEPRPLRIGVIGCGGRGSGAINDSLSINSGVTLVAAADLYGRNCERLWKTMREAHPGKVAATDTSHDGLDGYKRILDDPNVDVVHVTSTPGFHPLHVQAAIAAGKHVFVEKPACVDPVGYRTCLAAHDEAVAKGLAVGAGTQYRHQANFAGAVEQIHQGAIGDVIGALVNLLHRAGEVRLVAILRAGADRQPLRHGLVVGGEAGAVADRVDAGGLLDEHMLAGRDRRPHVERMEAG
ncbi:MAG: Gfo/Idh/MocA family protein, partial [Planctomycetia bacterium]